MSEINSTETSRKVGRMPLPPSPCVGVCTIDEGHQICAGCGRTPDDIARWPNASDAEKSELWRQLPARLVKLGVKTCRLPASPGKISEFVAQTLQHRAGRWKVGLQHASVQFTCAGDLSVARDGEAVQASKASGEKFAFRPHDRVRAFGLAGDGEDGGMVAVAFVVPRGRADMTGDAAVAAGSEAVDLPVSYPYCRFALQGVGMSDDAPRLSKPLTSEQTGKIEGAELIAESVLVTASMTAEADLVHELLATPADIVDRAQYAISKAFAVCAVFEADDPEWLAAAIAP